MFTAGGVALRSPELGDFFRAVAFLVRSSLNAQKLRTVG